MLIFVSNIQYWPVSLVIEAVLGCQHQLCFLTFTISHFGFFCRWNKVSTSSLALEVQAGCDPWTEVNDGASCLRSLYAWERYQSHRTTLKKPVITLRRTRSSLWLSAGSRDRQGHTPRWESPYDAKRRRLSENQSASVLTQLLAGLPY